MCLWVYVCVLAVDFRISLRHCVAVIVLIIVIIVIIVCDAPIIASGRISTAEAGMLHTLQAKHLGHD